MIDNLESKLSGQEAIDRDELIELISSWGRTKYSTTEDDIKINKCEPKEKYSLENLDVSQINDLSEIFCYSLYNGDLSKWDVSNCIYINAMFYESFFNNDSLKDWNTSNIQNMTGTFAFSNFNGDLSGWNLSNVNKTSSMFWSSKFNNNSISNWNLINIMELDFMFSSTEFNKDISFWEFNKNADCTCIFGYSNNFINKYNDGKDMPYYSKDFIKWFKENKSKIKELNQVTKDEVLEFFDFNNKVIEL